MRNDTKSKNNYGLGMVISKVLKIYTVSSFPISEMGAGVKDNYMYYFMGRNLILYDYFKYITGACMYLVKIVLTNDILARFIAYSPYDLFIVVTNICRCNILVII